MSQALHAVALGSSETPEWTPAPTYPLLGGGAAYPDGPRVLGYVDSNTVTTVVMIFRCSIAPFYPDTPGNCVLQARFSFTNYNDDLNGVSATMTVGSTLWGPLGEFTSGINLHTGPMGGPTSGTVTKTVDLATLLSNHGLTSEDLFAFPLTISIEMTWSITVVLPAVGFDEMQVDAFSFTIPNGTIPNPNATPDADIEVTGEGGVLVSGGGPAYLEMTLQVTGSGGVLVGSVGSEDTPLVLSTNPTGLYTLVQDQRFDRIYTRNVDPDDTTDVAIPRPFGKTGYIGG